MADTENVEDPCRRCPGFNRCRDEQLACPAFSFYVLHNVKVDGQPDKASRRRYNSMFPEPQAGG